ncbi:RICIN domain-containing protein [Streptomyces sp. AC602_WCS936]|uniref:RICIN domain-containing protein n=1 Tax=Streptomyces sp. AC602_WCS936 TaxID=2823685 RepID=UPI001C25D93E|nr:RICIN domain-containing protein [Streptomyces sp. AC602_WCS936]
MRKKFWTAVVTGATAVAALSLGAGPASAAATDTFYIWQNGKSGKCLSVEGGGSTGNNANAVIWTCNGGDEQYWGYYTTGELVNLKSGKCLSTASGGGTANGTEVVQYTCNGGSEQEWYRSSAGEWVNGKSGKCLSTAGGGGTSNGTKAIIYSCNGGAEQYWY